MKIINTYLLIHDLMVFGLIFLQLDYYTRIQSQILFFCYFRNYHSGSTKKNFFKYLYVSNYHYFIRLNTNCVCIHAGRGKSRSNTGEVTLFLYQDNDELLRNLIKTIKIYFVQRFITLSSKSMTPTNI